MARRQLVIERPSSSEKQTPMQVRVQVDDQAPIGSWITTLAAQFGYPLVDSFGAPIAYRLRSVSDHTQLPATGRFADTRFPSGSCFVLEPETDHSALIHKNVRREQGSFSAPHVSRRFLMNSGILTLFSFLGLTSGMTTAFAQRFLRQGNTAARKPTLPDPFTITVRTTFLEHQQMVRAITWSPDEKMVASGGNDDLALVWKIDGTVLYTLQFNAHVRAVAWSPDGLQIVSGSANIVSFFDARTGSLLAENTEQHISSITALGWVGGQTPDPLAISTGIDNKAIVWNGQSHQPRVVFRLHTTSIEALAVLTNTIATVSQGGVARVWSALNGQEVHGYYADTQQPLRSAAFSANGALATGSDDGIVHLWRDGRTCTQQIQDGSGLHCADIPVHLQGHVGPVRAITFSPDGMLLATGGDDKKLIIWSMQTMAPLYMQPQQNALAALSWSSSGQLLAGALGSHVVIWHIHF